MPFKGNIKTLWHYDLSENINKNEKILGLPLWVQWLRFCASNAGGMGLIPGGGTKIPHAAWYGQLKKNYISTCHYFLSYNMYIKWIMVMIWTNEAFLGWSPFGGIDMVIMFYYGIN